MALEQFELQASQLVADDIGSDGNDCQSFLTQLWQQTQQVVKAPPAKMPDHPKTSPDAKEARARYSRD